MSPRHLAGSLWCSFLLGIAFAALPAEAQTQVYSVDGSDAFSIAGRQVRSLITYEGTQELTFLPAARKTVFHATVRYRKNDGGTASLQHAAFALTMLPSGDVSNEDNADPDYLTILNQPFSVQLDRPTMHDLHGLARAVPFDFPSPMTGATLHGTLRRLLDGSLNGARVLGIAFSASGPLEGTLPDRPTLAVSGTITMNGTAYYAYSNALLLALDATLMIEGKVGGTASNDSVTIRYKRRIRPAGASDPGR
jgi:hypothetical protein